MSLKKDVLTGFILIAMEEMNSGHTFFRSRTESKNEIGLWPEVIPATLCFAHRPKEDLNWKILIFLDFINVTASVLDCLS